jgi:hypothetical protein
VVIVLSSAGSKCTMFVCMIDNDTIEEYKSKRWKVVLRIEAVLELNTNRCKPQTHIHTVVYVVMSFNPFSFLYCPIYICTFYTTFKQRNPEHYGYYPFDPLLLLLHCHSLARTDYKPLSPLRVLTVLPHCKY